MSYKNMRRNFWHNTVVHTRCAFVFLLADFCGMRGWLTLKERLIDDGERYHAYDEAA